MFQRFHRKKSWPEIDLAGKQPVLHCSICTGEQVAGFRDAKNGHIEEVCCIRNDADLAAFRERYGITGEIEKIY